MPSSTLFQRWTFYAENNLDSSSKAQLSVGTLVSLADARHTGYHGLPAEYTTPDGHLENWQAILRYLAALEKSCRPIVVAVEVDRAGSYLTQQIGFLRHHGQGQTSSSSPHFESFSLYWPDPEQLAGGVALYEHLFKGATLRTVDGDDYFWLALGFGELRIMFLDSNINLDRAHPIRRRELDDLPTADDFSREFAAGGTDEFVQKLRVELAGLRTQLIALGAERAAHMSDEEIMAEGVRVRWKLRQHLVAGESLSETEWIPAVAEAIIGGSE